MINKILLYSTVNYIQYPVVKHNGECEKKIYINMYQSLCCIPETNNVVNQLHLNSEKKKKKHVLLSYWFVLNGY